MEVGCEPNSSGNLLPVTLPHFKDMRKPTKRQSYQYVNTLINGKTAQEFENLRELVSLSTLPLFENSLQLIFIDSLHLENEVLSILLSQNDYSIQRILRCKWFFQDLSFELCSNQLFPYVSVSLRCKIINTLSKHLENADKAEKYFVFIRNNYDNERAEYLLPKCSPEFILNYFKKYNPTFEHNNGLRILLNICKRHVDVGIYLLSSIFDRKKGHELHKYKKILLYLAGYHPDSVAPILIKHRSRLPSNIFGKKLTKKLKSRVKDHLFPDFIKNLIFNEKHLFLILTFEEKVKMIAGTVIYKFKELTFHNWEKSNNRVSHFLKMVPAEDRLRMVQAAFNEVYNLDYNDHANCWFSEILEITPIKSRQPYVIQLEKILKTEVSERGEYERDLSFNIECPEELIYLYDSNIAFEKFKDIIRKTPSVERREVILTYMIKNCSINNDTKALQEMIEFIVVHHRNDCPNMMYRIINHIFYHFPVSRLSLIIFEKLVDLIYFFGLIGYKDCSVYNIVKEKQILCLLENNVNADSHVKDFFESIILKREFPEAFMSDYKSKHSRTLFLAICEKAVPWLRFRVNANPSHHNHLLESLLMTYHNFNNSVRHNRMFLKDIPGLNEVLLAKQKEIFSDVGAEDWPLDIWERYPCNNTYEFHKPARLLYILKKCPDIIDKHLAGVLGILLLNHYSTYNFCKKELENFFMALSFFDKTEKAKEILLNEFKKGIKISWENALKLYSYICTTEEFIEVIEEYFPKEEEDPKKSDADFNSIQFLILKLIKNVKPYWKMLQFSLKFFSGDYLKIFLPSFWACCYHTRYDYVIPFLEELLDRVSPKISYRKDIIRLIIELSDRKAKSNFYLKFWNEYKHYSVRSNLLLHISKSFLQQPSKNTFQVLEKCILDCDSQVITFRPNLQKIPKDFLNDYTCALWRFSENQKNPFKNHIRKEILSCFSRDNISLLSPEFCESIIKNNLFNPSSELEVDDFTVVYLVASSEVVESRVRMVLDLIKDRKPKVISIYHFFNILIGKSLENPINFAELFQILLENWPEYPNGVLFEERVLLTYYFLYQKVFKKTSDSSSLPVEFGKELKKFYQNVDSLNDLLIIYAETLKNFFNNFQTFKAILAIRELLEGTQDRTLAVLAILSMPMEAVVWHTRNDKIFDESIIESKKVLNDIVKTLESYDDRIVEIYLRSKFEFVK